MAEEETRITLRLDGQLHEDVKRSAGKHKRSLNAEIAWLLTQALIFYPNEIDTLRRSLNSAGDEVDRLRNKLFGGRSDIAVRDLADAELHELREERALRKADDDARAMRMDRLFSELERTFVKSTPSLLEGDVRKIIDLVQREISGTRDATVPTFDTSLGNLLSEVIQQRTELAMRELLNHLIEAQMLKHPENARGYLEDILLGPRSAAE